MPLETEVTEAAAPEMGAAPSVEGLAKRARLSVHPRLRDLGMTGLSSVLVAVAATIVISLVGKMLGPVLLGEYLLVRRMASWLQAVVVVPSGVALPRYVAVAADDSGAVRQSYFVSALLVGGGFAIALCLVLVLWERPVSLLLFGDPALTSLALPLGLFLLGLAVHGAVFGFYQGLLSMGRACAMQICNLALFPVFVVALLYRQHSIPLIVVAMSILMIVCALLFAAPIVRGVRLGAVLARVRTTSRELLSFGLSRTWGDFGLQAVLSLPAVVAAHYLPIRSVSFLLLGSSFLALVGAATLPLGTVLLSQVTRSLAMQRTQELRVQLAYFIHALIELSVFVSIQLLALSGAIVRIWVGEGFLAGLRVIQIVMLAVPFYSVYGGLRSVVDAAAVKAYNTRNIFISLAIFLALVCAFLAMENLSHLPLLEGLATAGVIAIATLACLTLGMMKRLFDLRVEVLKLLPGLGLAAALGVATFLFDRALGFEPRAFPLLLYEAVIATIYFLTQWLLRSPWLCFLVGMFRSLEIEVS